MTDKMKNLAVFNFLLVYCIANIAIEGVCDINFNINEFTADINSTFTGFCNVTYDPTAEAITGIDWFVYGKDDESLNNTGNLVDTEDGKALKTLVLYVGSEQRAYVCRVHYNLLQSGERKYKDSPPHPLRILHPPSKPICKVHETTISATGDKFIKIEGILENSGDPKSEGLFLLDGTQIDATPSTEHRKRSYSATIPLPEPDSILIFETSNYHWKTIQSCTFRIPTINDLRQDTTPCPIESSPGTTTQPKPCPQFPKDSCSDCVGAVIGLFFGSLILIAGIYMYKEGGCR